MNPDIDIQTIQNEIFKKSLRAKIHQLNERFNQLKQDQLDGFNSNILLMIYAYTMYVYCRANKFMLQSSQQLCLKDEMSLIYNGKLLCPEYSLSDYFQPGFEQDKNRGSCTNPVVRHHYHHYANHYASRFDMDYSPPTMTIHASYPIKGGCFIVSFSILVTMVMAVCMSFCTCGLSLVAIPLLAPFLFILPLFCL